MIVLVDVIDVCVSPLENLSKKTSLSYKDIINIALKDYFKEEVDEKLKRRINNESFKSKEGN